MLFLQQNNQVQKGSPTDKAWDFFQFARHGRALTGVSPEHAQIVGSV